MHTIHFNLNYMNIQLVMQIRHHYCVLFVSRFASHHIFVIIMSDVSPLQWLLFMEVQRRRRRRVPLLREPS